MTTTLEPHEIFQRTREEGRRRLTRSRLELVSTALMAGIEVVFGIVALGAVAAATTPHFGPEFGHMLGALAFGIGFVFIVAGRSELFTENFLVPVTALRQGDIAKMKLAELWTLSPLFNLVGGGLLVLIVSVPGVLAPGTGDALARVATGFDENSAGTALLSAIAAGALITAMTWIVEGTRSVGVRIVAAWIGGALLALAAFNHVVVVTLEMLFGMRYGADVGLGDVAQNFGLAAAGNLIGGLLFVTLTRTGQAVGSADGDGEEL